LYSPYNGYTDDSRAKAHLLKEAFRLNYCSFEVKSLADDASSSYDDVLYILIVDCLLINVYSNPLSLL